jgi:ATP-dependent protease HslVU (ClpYQ) peptidase subunit
MTCIAGVVHNGEVWIGGDSLGSGGDFCSNRNEDKVFRVGPYLIGMIGSFRTAQVIRYQFNPSYITKDGDIDVFEFMVTKFVAEMKALINANSCSMNGFLVGYKGRLFRIEPDYQVFESNHPYNAYGSGSPYAFGALYVNQKSNLSPHERITEALKAAEEYCPTVRGPFTIERANASS